MTNREKIGHLFRHLGFGATPHDLDRFEKAGSDEAMRHLIDYNAVDEQFPVSPYEFIWRDKSDADPGAYVLRLWWAMRMVAGQRPLQEQLTLFWHSHFAVSDAKVEDGPMMLQYLDTLRSNACGKFGTLLKAISKDPAMMRYLDMQRSLRGNPNENFAREVMELFTLGIGNYSESDVKEAARAFTGWSYVNMYWEYPGTNTSRLKESIKFDRPFSAFALMPAMHDPGPKTILGKTDFFDGDKFLDMLATHPQTARHICGKLWAYFAYQNPETAVIDRIAGVYLKTGGDIRRVMYAIAKSPEFWSDKCVRKKVKSPADLCVGVARQMGAGPALLALRGQPAGEDKQIKQPVMDNMWGICDRMEKAGLALLYPRDVSGWKGGAAWISPAAMVERFRYRGLMIWGSKGPGEGTLNVMEFVKSRKPADSNGISAALAEMFDVPLPKEGLDVLAAGLERRGGIKLLDHPDWFAGALDRALMTLMAAPEMHVC